LAAAIQRLIDETQDFHKIEAEVRTCSNASSADEYRVFLTRAYSFIRPLERCLEDTPGLAGYLDTRRFRKHLLLELDLAALGMRRVEVQSVPQCSWIPWFKDAHGALGWAFLIERITLTHPTLFRHIASVLPGEAAFAAAYLKCYSGAAGEMWNAFAAAVEASIAGPRDLEILVASATAAHRHYCRWLSSLDGRALSWPPPRRAASQGSSRMLELELDLSALEGDRE
jgi:heme oxygenase